MFAITLTVPLWVCLVCGAITTRVHGLSSFRFRCPVWSIHCSLAPLQAKTFVQPLPLPGSFFW